MFSLVVLYYFIHELYRKELESVLDNLQFHVDRVLGQTLKYALRICFPQSTYFYLYIYVVYPMIFIDLRSPRSASGELWPKQSF